MKLHELLKMPFEDFLEKRKEKKWFVVTGNGEKRFHDYYSWEEADQYLNSYGLGGHNRMPQLQIIDKQTGKKYCHKKARYKLQKREIFTKWWEGSSFVLTLAEFLNKQLWKQCEDFEEYFGRGQSNIYMSSQKKARCFPVHADTTENFLFHVRGTVRWYIYNETEYDCKPSESTVDKVIDLHEGDLLYLPPKLYHRVETLGPRISISFHFHPPKCDWCSIDHEEHPGKVWREEWLDWIGDING